MFLNLQDQQGAIEEVREIRRQDEETTSELLINQPTMNENDVREDRLDNDTNFFASMINLSWLEVVGVIEAAAAKVGITKPVNVPYHLITNRFVNELAAEGYIEGVVEENYNYLRKTRNQVVHRGVKRENGNFEEAIKYQKACKELIEAFKVVKRDF